jgi:4-amino-4-deoxychorismate lyase
MSLLFETIRILDGEIRHIAWHEQRMNRAREECFPGCPVIQLQGRIRIPGEFVAGNVSCNVFYGREIEKISFRFYEKRPVRSLKLVGYDTVDYHVKYSDRSLLETLFAKRGDCDDIIIVKNGMITDTSMSNLIFFDGKNWFTPAQPLLKGTCRDRLLAEGTIREREIRPEDLGDFLAAKLINAMREPEEEEMIPVEKIS